jgi:cytidylate kinase
MSMFTGVIVLAAFEGGVIIVGCGANLVLRPDDGLRVRVVADRAMRIASLAVREGLELEAAAQRLDEVDASRQNSVRRDFHPDLNDMANFALVIDTARFGLEGWVDLISYSLMLRGSSD